MKNKLNIIIMVLCIAGSAHAQRPLRWTADAAQTAQVTFDCTRGETLTFTPVLKAYGVTLTNYTASFQWQTNGMGTAFWSTNVLVFSPSMDVGASRYRFWIRAESTNGVMYSAQGTIHMLHGPGAIVNALPLPARVIDFATVTTTNALWLVAEFDPGIPSAITTAVAQANTNAHGYANAALSNAVLFASTNHTARIFNPTNSSEYIDGSGCKYTITPMWEITFSPDFMDGDDRKMQNAAYSITGSQYFMESPFSIYWTGGNIMIDSRITGIYYSGWWSTTNNLVLNPMQGGARGYAYVRPYSVTNLVATLATESQVAAKADATHTNDPAAHPSLFNAKADSTHTNDPAAHPSLFNAKADASRTITINGSTGSLSSNLTFTVSPGLSTNDATSIANAAVHGAVFTNQDWYAAGTNATYRMTWDTTNGTFRVEEILP
jgi:hypothetical protein